MTDGDAGLRRDAGKQGGHEAQGLRHRKEAEGIP